MDGLLMGILKRKPSDEPDGDESLDYEGGLSDAMEDLAEALAKVRELGYRPESERTEVDSAAMGAACKLAARAFRNAFQICESQPHSEGSHE